MDETEIRTNYESLLNATQQYFLAHEALLQEKHRLEEARIGAYRDGLITGKNDDERKLQLYSLFPELHRKIAVAEIVDRERKYFLDLANIAVDRTQSVLRMEEVAARRSGGTHG